MNEINKYNYNVKIERVVDGDTVDVMIDLGFNTHIKRRVRMYGINTPESRTRDLEEKKRGLAAKDRLIEIVNDNKIVMRSWGKGKYGRVLGELFIEEPSELGRTYKDINNILIKEGSAFNTVVIVDSNIVGLSFSSTPP